MLHVILAQLSAEHFTAYRRSVAAVFQDPYGALNPRMRVGNIITEPLKNHGYARRERQRLYDVLQAVGLPASNAPAFRMSSAVASDNALALPGAGVTT